VLCAGLVQTAAAADYSNENRSTVEVGKHRVTISMDASFGTATQDEGVTITFVSRKLEINFATLRIALNGAEIAKLPANTKEVEVQYTSGKLTVSADGSVLGPK
jgi:hypothetical protein